MRIAATAQARRSRRVAGRREVSGATLSLTSSRRTPGPITPGVHFLRTVSTPVPNKRRHGAWVPTRRPGRAVFVAASALQSLLRLRERADQTGRALGVAFEFLDQFGACQARLERF